ncbi:MAG: Flp pilus assembly protein CpaB [Devosiaceae bacterium]|nr:Flp pilus assembly protein CpaB [Devosiaceae bacterium]
MKPSRIILLGVAIVAGGLAALMMMQGDTPETKEAKTIIQEEPRVKILVARQGIGVGERLNSGLLEWQDWPSGVVRPEFITSEMAPNAQDELAGAVARFVFFEGEPIREAKLARSDQGYLSAVIEPGMRAVSISIKAKSGAGGFIVPNDRVDVVLTSRTDNGERSETILQNVKVLVIDSRFDYSSSQGNEVRQEEMAFSNETIAVLELNPIQSETIVNASEIGQLALILRSVADFGEQANLLDSQGANAEIRMIKFGKEVNVISGKRIASPMALQEVDMVEAGELPEGVYQTSPNEYFNPDNILDDQMLDGQMSFAPQQ